METSYERGFLLNSKKILAAAVSVAAIASLTACGGVKDDTTAGAASGNAITIGTTDKITSLDPAGSYDNGSYAVQIQVFPFLYAQDYNTSELSPDIAADDGTWNDDGTEFTVKLKDGLKFANGNDLTASDVKFSYDRIKKINGGNKFFDENDSRYTAAANSALMAAARTRCVLEVNNFFHLVSGLAVIQHDFVHHERTLVEILGAFHE